MAFHPNPNPPVDPIPEEEWEPIDFDEGDDFDPDDWYDHLSPQQQREHDEREAFNDRLDTFLRER